MKSLEIPLAIIADISYTKSDSLWKEKAKQVIENVNAAFQQEFKTKRIFQINNFIEWAAPAIPSLEDSLGNAYQLYENMDNSPEKEQLLKDLHRTWSWSKLTSIIKEAINIAGNKNKIAIILISDPEVPQIPPGISLLISNHKNLSDINLEMDNWMIPDEYFENIPECRILVRMSSANPANVLLHEIGAIFGAKHTHFWGEKYANKYHSVMNPDQVFGTNCFDPKNHSIVSKNISILLKSMASGER